MADIKISDLTAATSATASQQIEVNDGGTSKRVTVDQIKTYVGAQPSDATLTAIAGVTTAADRVPYFTGVDTAAVTPLTTFGRSLIDDASATEAKTTLGLNNVQNVDQTNASNLSSGTVGTARLGSGTANSTTYLRGDQTWATLAGRGAGGSTITSSTTLTASSDAVQRLAPTAHGMKVILPDATTLTEGTPSFLFSNTSGYTVEIFDSASNSLGFIPPSSSYQFSLVDNTTAAGVWDNGNAPQIGLITQSLVDFGGVLNDVGLIRFYNLDSNNYLCVGRYALLSNSFSTGFAVVVNKATGAAGAIHAFRATNSTTSISSLTVKVINSTTALVVSRHINVLHAQVLTISGTTVSSGTAAVVTLSTTTPSLRNGILTFGSSYVMSVRSNTTISLYAMTITGTTVTIGSAANLTASGSFSSYGFYAQWGFALSSTQGVTAELNGSTSIVFRPFTVSGTAITLGTSVSVTTTDSNYQSVSLLESGRLAAVYRTATNTWSGAIISVSGNVATSSTVSLVTATGTLSNIAMGTSAFTADFDSVNLPFWGNKVMCALSNTAGAWFLNVLEDVNGTATAKTTLTFTYEPSNTGSIRCLAFSSATQTGWFTATANSEMGFSPCLKIDLSGNPTITEVANHNNTETLIVTYTFYKNFTSGRSIALGAYNGSSSIEFNADRGVLKKMATPNLIVVQDSLSSFFEINDTADLFSERVPSVRLLPVYDGPLVTFTILKASV